MSTQNIAALLAAADKRNGFPAGTMASVMQQESGGSTKFLDDPSAYHYPAGPDGRRVAGHTGKVSTAFGPFGILESTGKDPGYGVAPLKDKSIGEQVRFASDYLAARSKSAGSLVGGLAGYGEGEKYAQQVAARTGGAGAAPPIPAVESGSGSAVVADAAPVPAAAPLVVASAAPTPANLPIGGSEGDAWQTFLRNMPQKAAQPTPVQVTQLAGYGQQVPQFQMPQFQATAPQSLRPNFEAFGSWGGRGRVA